MNLVLSIPGTLLSQQWWWLRELFFRQAPVYDPARESDTLYMFHWWVALAFFIPMMALMFYFVVKYRRRPGKPQMRTASHNTPLELTWSVVPTLLLVVMFFWGYWSYMDMVIAPSGAESARLIAQKWVWRLEYNNGGVSPETTEIGANPNAPVFYVPAGRPMLLRMTSMDVLHSFWVPALRKKFDIFPNRYTSYWLEIDPLEETGVTGTLEDGTPYRDYYVFCAEYCGDQHSEMSAMLRAVPPDYYDKWKQEVGTPDDPVEWGKLLYTTRCATCHSNDGSRLIGPTWLNLWGSTHGIVGGGTVTVDANYVRESVYDPTAKIVEGYPNQMNSFQGQISEDELSAIIAYMKSISEHTAPGELPQEEPEGGEPSDATNEATPEETQTPEEGGQ